MDVAWATDLHLSTVEPDDVDIFCDRIRETSATCLLLGGDTAEAGDLMGWLTRLRDLLPIPIYFVLGNHEFYGSSIAAMHERMARLEEPGVHWLPSAGCVPLSDATALVGQGGLADARAGDFLISEVIMTDFFAIAELAELLDSEQLKRGEIDRLALMRRQQELGSEAADRIRPVLFEAADQFGEIVFLTHVPPFVEACWYGGRISEPEWLPCVSCLAVGEVVLEVAEDYPDCNLLVLCGHTHGEGEAQVASNVRVLTGDAGYGRATFRLLSVS